MLVFMNTTWDIEGIRSQYPALKDGTAYLDGAGGTQVPECVIEAISDAYRCGLSNVRFIAAYFRISQPVTQMFDKPRFKRRRLRGRPQAIGILPNLTFHKVAL